MEQVITFSELNDFIFCPMSLYYHEMFKIRKKATFQTTDQTSGSNAHETVDKQLFASKTKILQGLSVYTEKYQLLGKIDTFNFETGELIERKKKIKKVFDGYIFQIYGQIFALEEMGLNVKKANLYSIDDHKFYSVPLPSESEDYLQKFEAVLNDIRHFEPSSFEQTNLNKCRRCIYAPLCDQEVVC